LISILQHFFILMKIKILIFLFLLSFVIQAQTPTKIELVNANSLEFDQSLGADVRRLIGNVIFRHEETMMYCDSAYLYGEQNRLRAFGNIRINKGDTLNLTGNVLDYNGNTSYAQLFGNVRMSDTRMVLTTEQLDYNLKTETAVYPGDGKIVDQENTLTSQTGSYNSKTKLFSFRGNVVLINPGYVMRSDTLQYHTITKIAYFYGPTTITSTENVIYCQRGWYNTTNETSRFYANASLHSGSQTLSGDTLNYDRKSGIGKAFGNIEITDTVQNLIVNGQYSEYHEQRDWSIVTGETLLTMIFQNDSLFLHADTLESYLDTSGIYRILNAYHGVKFFKSDLQGSCDSLVYTYSDSTARFYHNPVLWSGENQLTADHISMQQGNGEIQRIYLFNDSFIVSREDTLRYNQIKGKDMTGYFIENKLYRVEVEGNGQTIYYAKNNKDQKIGVNRADSSDLLIFVKDNQIESISLIDAPEATFYPLNELKYSELILKGFKWLAEKRPATKEEIFKN
jgi:lipopolysaccharide assembly outer membrane protein LptD (OstA)